MGICVIRGGFARGGGGDGGAGSAGGGDGGKFGVGGGGGAGFGEELVERERFPGGGSDAADVALGPGDDFLFEGEGDAGGGHDRDDHAGDEAGGEVEPEDDFTNGHEWRGKANAARRGSRAANDGPRGVKGTVCD